VKVRALALAFAGIGLVAVVVLLVHAGIGTVLDALAVAGWPLLWLVPLHALPLALDASSWRLLLAPRDPQRCAGFGFLLAVASVREAVNRLLPVAGVGGELVGIRMVAQRGLGTAPAAASVVAEVVLTLVSTLLFAALGLGLLVVLDSTSVLRDVVLSALVVALPVPIACLWLIDDGRAVKVLIRLASKLFGVDGQAPAWLESMQAFEAELAALARRRGRLAAAIVLQLAGMIAGASEVWLALALLGNPVGIVPAIVVESVVLFVRTVAFAVPATLGAQEGAIVLVGAAIGLPQDVALELALAKRMREVLFSVPALLAWGQAAFFARDKRGLSPR